MILNFLTSSDSKIVFLKLLLLYICAFNFFYVNFQGEDDVVMQQIIRGNYTGNPDVHLVFVNVIIGYLLKPFYLMNSNIYWYSILFTLLQGVSIFVLLKYFHSKIKGILPIIIVYVFCLYFIVNYQFTIISGLLCISGFVLLRENHFRYKNVVIIIFFMFSFLLRLEMFILTMVLCSSMYLKEFKGIIVSYRKIWISLFVLFSISYWINSIHYKSDEWIYYNKYNKIRGQINDNPNLYKLNSSFPSIDNKMIFSHFIYLKDDNLQNLEKYQKVISINLSEVLGKFWWYAKNINSLESMYKLKYLIILILVSLPLVFQDRKKTLPFMLFGAAYLWIFLDKIPKDRVFIVLLFALLLYYLNNFKSNPLLLLFYILIPIWSLYPLYNMKIPKDNIPINKNVVMLDRGFINAHPFKLNCNGKNVITGGWLTNSPLQIAQLAKEGIVVKQHISLVDNPRINNKVYYHLLNDSKLKASMSSYLKTEGKFLQRSQFEDFYRIKKIE